MDDPAVILTLNGGSSSVKFAVFTADPAGSLKLSQSGQLERLGLPEARLVTNQGEPAAVIGQVSREEAIGQLFAAVERRVGLDRVQAVGHRVVHGGPRYHRAVPVTPEVLAELRRLSPFDPDHLPGEIALIEDCARRVPQARQVACFDTAFHHDMPRVATIVPIPRRFEAIGVRRYGFHGLSYQYLLEELERRAGRETAEGRVVLAHLGAGASLAAVRDGRSIDTSMGFMPTSGIPMATRSGDLDPSLASFLAATDGMPPDAFHDMVNHRSGLLGVSETSGDVRNLLACEATDVRAAEALALFCYQIKKWIGALAAALDGLDTLVFSGGIGEHACPIRARICTGLEFLGVALDAEKNGTNASIISSADSRVRVYVIPTDEELMIARATRQVLSGGSRALEPKTWICFPHGPLL